MKTELSRRDLFKVAGIGILGGIGGGILVNKTPNLFSLERKPKFSLEVYIYSSDWLKNSNSHVMSSAREIVKYNPRVMKINFIEGSVREEIDIYEGHRKIGSDVCLSNSYKQFFPARIGKRNYHFVVDSPSSTDGLVIDLPVSFMTNEELLNKIIEAEKKDLEGTCKNDFEVYSLSPTMSIGNKPTPNACDIKIKGDNVSYNIRGLEILTGGDKELFKRFWAGRNLFRDYKHFKETDDYLRQGYPSKPQQP